MLSKWEWIAKACESNGLKKSTTIAIELENLLRRIYGDTKTTTWEKDYKFLVSFSIKEINRVMWSSEYCIGCEHSCKNGLNCDECFLAIEDFRCGSPKSLFERFRNLYKRETNHLMNLT